MNPHHWKEGREGFLGAGFRMQRGDMGPIILSALKEKPMHGYEIIRTLEERSHGFWRPSAGSIYPTLQLLEEQGMVSSKELEGKKVYSLTEVGEVAASGQGPQCGKWEGRREQSEGFRDAVRAFREVTLSLRRIAFHGSEKQQEDAKRVIAEASRKLEEIAAFSAENN